MHLLGIILSIVLIVAIFLEAFETILSPRRVMHRFRYARLFYRSAWWVWRKVAGLAPAGKKRASVLAVFGPASLLALFATWVTGLIFGFALFQYCTHSVLHGAEQTPSFWEYLYLSGTTFFTLGYGDLTPAHGLGRTVAVIEAGSGFAFLAILISYLPVLYQAFSSREVVISLLDARAGSPPSGGEVLTRLSRSKKMEAVDTFLREWELWAAQVLESHLSFPVLSYYRSQHDNQSWLAALATILDTAALVLILAKEVDGYQSQLTFAMARHAAVDLALVLKVKPGTPQERLLPADYAKLRRRLSEAGLVLQDHAHVESRLRKLRGTYEPFLQGLADRLMFTLPPIFVENVSADNWQRSAWMELPPGIGSLPNGEKGEHF